MNHAILNYFDADDANVHRLNNDQYLKKKKKKKKSTFIFFYLFCKFIIK